MYENKKNTCVINLKDSSAYYTAYDIEYDGKNIYVAVFKSRLLKHDAMLPHLMVQPKKP